MQRKPAVTAYELAPVLAERWSPRAFDPRDVPDALLGSLLEAVRWAPSSSNLQPWRLVVGRRGGETFARIAATLTGRNVAWAPQAPLLVLALASTAPERTPSPATWHDVGLAQAMLLVQASASGLVTHVMAGFDRAAATQAFGRGPHEQAVTVTAVGFPGDPATLPEDLRAREAAPRSRKPLAEIASGDVATIVGEHA